MRIFKKNKSLEVNQQYIVKADWCILNDSVIKIVNYAKDEKKYYFKLTDTKLTHDKNTYIYKGSFREDEEFRFLLKLYNPKKENIMKNVIACFKLGYMILKLLFFASILTTAYYGSIYLTNYSKDINISDLGTCFNLMLQIVVLIMFIIFCIKKLTKHLTGIWLPIKYRITTRKTDTEE